MYLNWSRCEPLELGILGKRGVVGSYMGLGRVMDAGGLVPMYD